MFCIHEGKVIAVPAPMKSYLRHKSFPVLRKKKIAKDNTLTVSITKDIIKKCETVWSDFNKPTVDEQSLEGKNIPPLLCNIKYFSHARTTW